MYYLGDICFVCLGHNEKFITYFNIDLMAREREIPKSIIVEYIFRKTKTSKLCVGCLDRMFTFSQRDLINNSFISYVKQLKKECGINKYVADVSTDMLLLKKCRIYNHKNNERKADEQINKKHKSKIKNGILYTDDYKLGKEFITKEESCTFEDVMLVVGVAMKSEHLHYIDEQSVNRVKHKHFSENVTNQNVLDCKEPPAEQVIVQPKTSLIELIELMSIPNLKASTLLLLEIMKLLINQQIVDLFL